MCLAGALMHSAKMPLPPPGLFGLSLVNKGGVGLQVIHTAAISSIKSLNSSASLCFGELPEE